MAIWWGLSSNDLAHKAGFSNRLGRVFFDSMDGCVEGVFNLVVMFIWRFIWVNAVSMEFMDFRGGVVSK